MRRRGRGWGLAGPSSPNPAVNAMALAIAQAEGYQAPGTIPNRQNNPGDITVGGQIATFATPQAGWDALTKQVELMLGGSQIYSPSMTLAEAGNLYSGGDPNWAKNVAASLGVSTNATIGQILGTGGAVPQPSPAQSVLNLPGATLSSPAPVVIDTGEGLLATSAADIEASLFGDNGTTTGIDWAIYSALAVLAVLLLAEVMD